MSLTPQQRHELVTTAHECLLALGEALVEFSKEPRTYSGGFAVTAAYNRLAFTLDALCREMDWPSRRPMEKQHEHT